MENFLASFEHKNKNTGTMFSFNEPQLLLEKDVEQRDGGDESEETRRVIKVIENQEDKSYEDMVSNCLVPLEYDIF